jgi:hypothetical protein
MDKREEIISSISGDSPYVYRPDVVKIMDEYMKVSVIEAFEFVAKNTTGKHIDEKGKVEFKYNGEWITPEKLFESFL